MWRDLKYGVRQISRRKLFSAVVILLLAVGIGANTVIFSFVNALLLKPLPIRSPENLYLLQKMRVKQVRPDTSFYYRQFQAVAQEKKLFSGAIAEQEWFTGNLQPFSASDSVRLITTQIVSPNYFSELGVKAIRGRVLNEIINATRRILRRLAPKVPIIEALTLEQEVQNSLWQARLVTILCAFFGITALLLSATGLYGALAYSVTRRSRELEIRVAIGAQARHILQTVCLRMMVSVGLGLLGGLLCSVAVMRLAASLVFGARPDDPLSFGLAAAVLLLCICFAAAPPTWRATKTDPALALRAE